MKIADIELGEKPLLLAPMEDVTDPSFRYMCKRFGADVVYTEFISSDGLIRDAAKSLKKLEIDDAERPVGIQLYGHLVEPMVEAARMAEAAGPDIIDINFGCPVKRVAGKGAGAGMLQNIPLMLEITRAVVDAVKIPVTVKTRLGWDANSKIIVDLAEQLQDCGIAALTIHGRTRAQMYTGEADWTLIGEVKKNPRMHIPIIGNGDITTPQRAKECFDLYGVDAIMIGRASFGRPWFFKEVKHYLETGEELPPLSSEWRLNVLRQEVEDSVNLLESAEEMHQKEIHFSKDAQEELQVLEDAVQDTLSRTTDAFRKGDLHLASKVEPLEAVVNELVRAIKARHVARLQAGSCSIEYGFVLDDLLTNYERVCDHCSNVAVAQIEVAQDSFDTHAYLNDLRHGNDTKESEEFHRRLGRYRERYLFPDGQTAEEN